MKTISKTKDPSWADIAAKLGIAERTLHTHRAKPGSPKSKDIGAWRKYFATAREAGDTPSMAALKARLCEEQGRKEAALASLRELELKVKVENLVPESDVMDRLKDVLIPLRRLLDALPRAVASQANPQNPNVAEVAIRKALDRRVFSEIQRILLENAEKLD